MRAFYIRAAALLAVMTFVSASAAHAQQGKSALVDSVNKGMLRTSKPAKTTGSSAAAKTNASSAKAGSTAGTKAPRVVPVPAIVSQSGAAAPKAVRTASAADSATTATPPVRRAPKVAKTKPPAK